LSESTATALALDEAVLLAHALVDRVCTDLGIKHLFIKGPIAARQGLRPVQASVDVDVLVDPARRPELARALTKLGWVDEHPYTSPTVLPRHAVSHRHRRWPCELDLHDRFPGLFADPAEMFDILWERRTTVELAARDLPCPDVVAHALILGLNTMRDPHHVPDQEPKDLVERLRGLLDEPQRWELSHLADQLGAADTAAPLLHALGVPGAGEGTTPAADLRSWHMMADPPDPTAVPWVNALHELPLRRWPGFLWYAATLSDIELRLAEPNLPDDRLSLLRARGRRLRRGLRAVPGALKAIDQADSRTIIAERTPTSRAHVVVVQEILTGYRVPFYRALREQLGDKGITLTLLHGHAPGARATRGDAGSLPWALTSSNRYLRLVPGKRAAVWQPVPRRLVRDADLVIVEQANRQLVNYPLLMRYLATRRPRFALWGHGGNLQLEAGLTAWSEKFKARVGVLPHWWFAYTQGVADRVEANGFPRERITVVQNAVATPTPSTSVTRIPAQCVYIGSLYGLKRIPFLIAAADEIAALRSDFRLVVIGDGEDRGHVEEAAQTRPWLDYRGYQTGDEAFDALRQSSLLLMPGLVGLAIVDAFAAECPLVTVDVAFHSPEVEYLVDGMNGVRLDRGISPQGYGRAVAGLLDDPARLEQLRAGCRVAASTYTLDAMVSNFAAGIVDALA
jgi:glycosyltransferase involved in cell wall biosynthesis